MGRPMKPISKLVIIRLLGALFGWIWICAATGFLYFLFGALTNEESINPLFWSIGVGFIAKYLADTFRSAKEQVEYVDQLKERGYTRADTTNAWEIAKIGGHNLLLNLQQAERIAENDLKYNEGNNSNAK